MSETVAPPWTRWIGVVFALVGAACAPLAHTWRHEWRLIAVAAVALVAWSVGVWAGWIRIRRRDQVVEPVLLFSGLAISLIVSFSLVAWIAPPHESLVFHMGAFMTAMTVGLLVGTAVVRPVARRMARKPDPGVDSS